MVTDRQQELLQNTQTSATELGMETCQWDPTKKPPGSLGKYDLLIHSNASHMIENIQMSLVHMKSILNPQGFLLVHDSSPDLSAVISVLKEEGFILTSRMKTLGNTSLLLFRLEKDSLAKVCFRVHYTFFFIRMWSIRKLGLQMPKK